MVVVIETGILQTGNLIILKHAKGHAGFHTQLFDAFDHGGQHIHIAVLGAAPCGTHAVAGRAALFGFLGLRDHALDLDQLGRGQFRAIAGRLRTIGAIFGTATGLDRQKLGALDLIGIEMGTMHSLRLVKQVHERLVINLARLFDSPILLASHAALHFIDNFRGSPLSPLVLSITTHIASMSAPTTVPPKMKITSLFSKDPVQNTSIAIGGRDCRRD